MSDVYACNLWLQFPLHIIHISMWRQWNAFHKCASARTALVRGSSLLPFFIWKAIWNFLNVEIIGKWFRWMLLLLPQPCFCFLLCSGYGNQTAIFWTTKPSCYQEIIFPEFVFIPSFTGCIAYCISYFQGLIIDYKVSTFEDQDKFVLLLFIFFLWNIPKYA